MDTPQSDTECTPSAATIASLEFRLIALEALLRDQAVQIDQVHHLAELVLSELHTRRRDMVPHADDGRRKWSAAGFPIIARNWPVLFGAASESDDQGDAADFLAHGWWTAESWGVWGRDELQVLRFAIENYGGGYIQIRLTVQGFAAPGVDHPTVDFTANGYFLSREALRLKPQRIKLRLPPSCLGDGDVSLYMKHSAPLAPSTVGLNDDERVLALGLISMDVG
jgi:hypothetical protein